MRFVDLAGRRFNNWTAISYSGKSKWLCQCDCGHKVEVNRGNLANGSSTKCRKCGPSIAVINKLPTGVAAFNDLYGRYRRSASQRKIEWSISKEYSQELLMGRCDYCGSQPESVWPKWHLSELNGSITYSGIDRLDSKKGYVKGNCVSCCKTCNYMKRSLSVSEFYIHIDKISAYSDMRLKCEAL